MEENPTITIACPVRNREWVLPYYLDHITKLTYPSNKIFLLFILNNSTDSSQIILENFKKTNFHKYNSIKIKTLNFKEQPDDCRTLNRLENYSFLAELRNYITSLVNTDYLFSVDSDILITNVDVIERLLSHKKNIVSGLICNGFIQYPEKPFNRFNTGRFNKEYKSLTLNIIKNMLKNNEILYESDLTGAICLISKEVYKNPNIKYGYTSFGEDLFWCKCANNQGYKLYTDITLYQQHIMSEEILKKYLDKTIEIPYNTREYNLSEVKYG